MTDDFLLWQLMDSALPTGGFAHSGGLEAAWHHGELRDANELESFIDASISQCGRASLPFMTASHREPNALIQLDESCESFTLNHVTNRASRAQGRALLAVARRIFSEPLFQTARPP